MSAWLDHLWQSTILAVLVLLGLAAGGRWLTAATRRALLAVALGQFLLPGPWVVSAIRRLAPPADRWIQAQAVPIQLTLPALHRAGSLALHRPGFTLALEIGWAAGVAAVLAIAVLKTLWLRRSLDEESHEPSDYLRERWAGAIMRAGLPALTFAPCEVCAEDRSPGVLGLLHPLLFVPDGLEQLLSEEELDAVLLHEAVHLQRGDNGWSALQTVIVALNWFNPLAWLISRQLQLETEMSCDERVLRVTGNAPAYLRAIAKSVRHSLGLLPPGFAPVGSTPVGLRLGNILAFPPRASARTAGLTAVGGLVLATLLSGYAGRVSTAALGPEMSAGTGGPDPELFAGQANSGAKEIAVLLVRPHAGDRGGAGTLPDVMPAPIEQPEPVYPLVPRMAGVSGAATLKYTVTADGGVKEVEVETADRQDFGQAAAEAVRRWRFVPAEREGMPVPARLEVKVIFSAQAPLPRELAPQDRPVAVSFR